ncbi:MAG TPA: hypothetical protein VJ999_13930 [Candidatus Sulfotelmatobacter sp.]|nr:hypothetical protein [Candidatus Sulfotelmatobacter sp.]
MFPKNRSHVRFAALGLAITIMFVVYQLATDPISPSSRDHAVMITFMIFCPPSLLSVPIIDAEVGSRGFYFVWGFIGLLNAALYAAVGAMIFGRRQKSD